MSAHTLVVGAKILIVDDDAAHTAALAAYLRGKGFQPLQSADALSAVVVAQKQSPALLILDFEIPAGTGMQVYERLRMLAGNAQLPAIFITGFASYVNSIAVNIPSVRVLSKPVDLEQLLVHIHEMLRLPPPSAPAGTTPTSPNSPA